jgi:rubrerythrin
MFTFGDIKNIAIQIEKNGEESYRQAAARATDPEVTEILLWMAEQEKAHADWFAQLQSTKILTEEQKEIEAMGKALLQDMIRGNNFLLDQQSLVDASTVEAVIEVSIKFEQETVLFYEFLCGFIDDPETMEQLQKIIAEEKSHVTKLEKLLVPEAIENRAS